MNTYAMESFKFLILNKFANMLKPCFLLCRYGVWSVDYCEKKKQFNIRQQHNEMKKMKGYEYFHKALYFCCSLCTNLTSSLNLPFCTMHML